MKIVFLFLVVFLMSSLLFEEGECWRRRRRRQCSARECQVSHWSSWSHCSRPCGSEGRKYRTRYKTVTESCGGWCSYSLRDTQSCNYGCGRGTMNHYGGCTCDRGYTGQCCDRCVPTGCQVSPWSSWSICSYPCGNKGQRHRTRHKTATESCGGTCASLLEEVVGCNWGCGHGGVLTYHGGCFCKKGFIGSCCDGHAGSNSGEAMGGSVFGGFAFMTGSIVYYIRN